MRELLEEGKGVNEIAEAARGHPGRRSRYHKRKLGYPMRADCGRRYDWAAIQRYYDAGHSVRRVHASSLAFRAWAWAYAVKRGADRRPSAARCRSKSCSRADTPRGRNNIKQRLLAAGLKRNRCEECGISRWRERPLSLCLHHVNGERHDNRLENLVLLCPNCHSQTPNFGSKNCRRRPE